LLNGLKRTRANESGLVAVVLCPSTLAVVEVDGQSLSTEISTLSKS
jgi:hypothetical protein